MTNRNIIPSPATTSTWTAWRYHYLDEGSGEPVVMVHGNPSWSFYYRNLVAGPARPLPLHRSGPYRLRLLRQAG